MGRTAPLSPNRLRALSRLERVWCLCLVAVVIGAAAISATQMIASSSTTIGDEVRFGAEARAAVAQAQGPSYGPENLALSVRAFGVPTTADLYGAAKVFQPGPVPHLLAMPFVRALGVRDGLWVFAATLNALALLVAAWSAFRTSGLVIAGWVAAGGFLTATLTTGTLTSALNVNLAVLPCFAAFVVAWGLAMGDLPMLAVLAASVSLTLQIHMAYGLTPVIVSVVALALLVRRGTFRDLLVRRHLLPTILVVLTFWSLPALDQVAGSGNLGRLLTTRVPGQGLEGAWNGLGAILRLPPAVRPRADVLVPPSLPSLVLVLVCVGAAARYRKKLQPYRELIAIAVAVVGGSLLVAAMSPSGAAAYHLYWIGLAVGFGITALGVPLLTSLRGANLSGMAEPTRARVTAVLSVALLAAAAVPLVPPSEPPPTRALVMAATRSIVDDLVTELDPSQRWIVTSRGGFTAEEVANGVAAHLADRGFSTRQGTTAAPGERTLVVASGTLRADGRGTVIARYGEAPASTDALTAELAEYVDDRGPVVVSDADPSAIVKYLDGRAVAACPSQFELDRSQVRALDPGALAGLFAHEQVLSPVLPDDLQHAVDDWLAQQAFTVYRLDDPSSSGQLAFSELDCGDD